MNCVRKYIAIYTFELCIIQVNFPMVLKLQILSLITVILADGIDAWDNDYIKFNMKKLESEYGVNGENKIKSSSRLAITDSMSSCPMNRFVPLTRKYQVQSRKNRYFFMFLCMIGIIFFL